jgi:hypothetical protein
MRFLSKALVLGICVVALGRVGGVFGTHLCSLRADENKNSSTKYSPEQSRRALEEKARQDPAWYERMLRDLDAFQSLPADQQERMRQLDKQLSAQNAAINKKLMKVLERYVNWLEKLPETDRKFIEDASNSKERLQRIRQVREKQWIQTLPKAVREEIMHAKGAERQALIKKYRQEEKKRRQEWDAAMKRGLPPSRAGKVSDDQPKKNQKDQ